MKTLQGIAASRGIGIGPAFHFRRADLRFERRAVEDPAAEWARLEAALETAHGQLADVYTRARLESRPKYSKPAVLVTAHLLWTLPKVTWSRVVAQPNKTLGRT